MANVDTPRGSAAGSTSTEQGAATAHAGGSPGARTRTSRIRGARVNDEERAADGLARARHAVSLLDHLADQLDAAIIGRDYRAARAAAQTIRSLRPGLVSSLADADASDTERDELSTRAELLDARLAPLLAHSPDAPAGLGVDLIDVNAEEDREAEWKASLGSPAGAGAVPHRAEMEGRFGASFGDVTATVGDSSLGARGLRASAAGNEVRFAEPAPSRDLVAHELTHVVQQRQAGVATEAFSDESHPADDAEVEAREVADRVREGDGGRIHVRAVPTAAVQYSRDDGETAKARTDAYEGNAPLFFDHSLRQTLATLRVKIADTEWTLGHPRVAWSASSEQIAQVIVARLRELAEQPAGAVYRAKHFPQFWHGVDLWNLVDTYRFITQGSPGEYKDGEPTAKGPLRWNSTVDDAVAIEFIALLRTSLARMVPRLVAAADDARPAGRATESSLVTSAPIDQLWARVLADPKLVTHTNPTGAAGEAPTPDGPGVFRNGLRPVVFEWMGQEDFRMWNVLRVTWPNDATAEEVSATLYSDENAATPQSHHAHAIVNAAPLFILPKTWAAKFPAAVKWASAEHAGKGDEPLDDALSSHLTNEAALAQGADEGHQKLASKGKAGRADTRRLTDLLWQGAGQLSFLSERLAPWKLDRQLEIEKGWIQRRAMELHQDPPERIAQWAPVIEHQQHVILEAGAAIVDVIDAAGSAGLAAGAPAASPFRRTLAAYVQALGASHLADLARSRMFEAEAERGQLAFAFLDGALAEATTATESFRDSEAGTYGPGGEAHDLVSQRKQLQRQRMRLRHHALNGEDMGAEPYEDLAISAGILTVRTRAKELGSKAQLLSTLLANASDDAMESVAGLFESRFDTLQDQLMALSADCQAMELNLNPRYEAVGVVVPEGREAQEAQRKADREERRARLARAQAELAALPVRHKLDHLSREAVDTITDNQYRMLAIEVAILIAASIATSGAAAAAGGAVRGAMLSRAAIGTARFATMANRARYIAPAVDVLVDAGLTGAVQTAVTGDDFGTATAENVLANVAVRAALARFQPLVAGLDEEAMTVWETGGLAAKGGVMLSKSAVITAEMVTAAGVGYAVQRIVRGKQPTDDELVTWVMQGASIAIGRMIASRTTQLTARLKRYGTEAAYLHGTTRKQADLADRVEAKGATEDAVKLLISHRALLFEEAKVLRELAADPVKREALHLSMDDYAVLKKGNAEAQSDTSKQGMDVMTLRFAGMTELVAGGLWTGDSKQLATALRQARAAGSDVDILETGGPGKRWRVKLGDRTLEIEERTTDAAGKTTSADRQARALLRARAAKELSDVQVSAVTGERGMSYYVAREDGERMLELLGSIDDVQVRKYESKGFTVHHAGKDWYFQWAPEGATAGHAALRTKGATLGLPASNASVIEFWGFRGVKKVNGVYWKNLPPKERAEVERFFKLDPLLHYGHVGISFDGGKTIYGLTPPIEGTPTLTPEQVKQKVLSHEPVPGIVKVDNSTFGLAAEVAREHGWDIEMTVASTLVDADTKKAAFGHALAQAEINPDNQHGKQYQFPYEQPDVKGAHYADENTRNCATYPGMLGLCVPEPSGQLKQYIEALKEWEREGPIDLTTQGEP